MTITIKEIADKANTSIATVSRVMNEPEKVSEETRKKILDIMHEYNYRKNQLAKGLVSGKTQIISLITPEEDELFNAFYFKKLFLGISKGASERGYCMLVDKRNRYGNSILHDHVPVDGYILISPEEDSLLIKRLRPGKTPSVLINRKIDEFSWVDIDNKAAIKEIVAHLADLGHKDIGIVTGEDSVHDSVERIIGYKSALEKSKLKFDPSYILNGKFTEAGAYEQVDRMISCKLPVSALIACSDLMAVGAIKAVRNNGMKVPEDIAVVGFDDIDGICFFNPSITTYRQPFFAIGRYAANLLADHIEGKKRGIVNKEFKGKLILRESCGVQLSSRKKIRKADLVSQVSKNKEVIHSA